jgi:hypothetical protein
LLEDICGSGLDGELTGFEQNEIDKFFQTLAREKGQIAEDDFDGEAEAAKITEPITKPGDIWELGRHRLMCGDSTDIGQVATLCAGAKIALLFTDPPWNVDYGGDQKHPSWKPRQILNDKMSKPDLRNFCRSPLRRRQA